MTVHVTRQGIEKTDLRQDLQQKGIQGPDSDIDLLVEIIEPRFDFLAGIQLHLEKKLASLSM